MKKTAVEWLIQELFNNGYFHYGIPTQITDKAKEMEKEQIIEAYEKGYTEDIPYPVSGGYYRMNAEQYYNETYKNGKR